MADVVRSREVLRRGESPSEELELQRLQRDVPQEEEENLQEFLQREEVAEEAGVEVEEENLQDFLHREQILELQGAERIWSPKVIGYIILWILLVLLAIIGLILIYTSEDKMIGICVLTFDLATIVIVFLTTAPWKMWRLKPRAIGAIDVDRLPNEQEMGFWAAINLRMLRR